MIKTARITTPLGEMIAAATGDGLCLLEFSDNKELNNELEELKKLLDQEIKEGRSRHIRHLKKQLKEYFTGKRKEFNLPLLIPGTEFQQSAWKELQKIPYGETISYHHQAEALNNPGAVRAVAGANGSNRIAIIIHATGDRCRWKAGGFGGCLNRKNGFLMMKGNIQVSLFITSF